VNFAKGSNPKMEQSKIMKTYNSVLARMGSRFMIEGKIAGMLFLVSSKKSEYDFIESYINKKKDKPNVYVCDARLWDVKPSGTYSGKKFYVALGGSNLPSKIIGTKIDLTTIADYKNQGYNILDVPIEFYDRFEMDIDVALMDIAGISISHVTKFIVYDNLIKCYNKSPNPFTSNIISIGMKDKLEIKDFFVPSQVPEELYSKPLFIHIDTSLTGDIEGLGCVARMGYKYLNKYNVAQGDFTPTKELMFRHVFSLGIKCPSGTELSFQKLRNFIYYLKYQLDWNIKAISLDGYQSADCKQQFITMGFTNSIILSLDRTADGYLAFKYSINEKRISLLHIQELELELINLERDNVTGKIDHPLEGTKDISDGLAGAVYNASLYKDNALSDDAAMILEDVNDYSDNPNDILSNLLSTELFNKSNNIILEPDDPVNVHMNNNSELSLHDALNLYLDEITPAVIPNETKASAPENQVINPNDYKKEDIVNLAKRIKAMTLSGVNNNIDINNYNDNFDDGTLLF